MAMLDYGALVKINGKIVNEEQFFMDMEKAVGWIDYPRIRYGDCNCLDDEGYSDCGECPRRQTRHHSDPELGEWDSTIGDCRGNKMWIDNKLDRNYFAYAGDEGLTVAVYKSVAVFANKNNTLRMRLWGLYLEGSSDTCISASEKMVKYLTIHTKDETVYVKIKKIAECSSRYYMRFIYKNNVYELVYGYGIDSKKQTWDFIKHSYCDKKSIRFVDKFWN